MQKEQEPSGEWFIDDEAQRRFEKLVQTALNTPPKPMKDVPRKRPAPKDKPGKAVKREHLGTAPGRRP